MKALKLTQTENQEKEEIFLDRLNRPETIEGSLGEIDVIDIEPYSRKSQVPVLFVGGWSESPKSLTEAIKEANLSGYRTIAFSTEPKPVEPMQNIGKYQSARAVALLDVIDNRGLDRVDVIAHSQGAINAIAAAAVEPEKFRNIVLIAPAGMIGQDSKSALIGRFGKKLARDYREMLYIPEIRRTQIEGTKYLLKHNLEAVREALELASARIDDSLDYLKKKGVRVSIIQSHSDTVFPADRIEENVDLSDYGYNVAAYASIADRKAGHDRLIKKHAISAGKAALQMIEQFND